jgi:hypothetical protein
MALGLVFVIVVALTTLTGFFPSTGITHAQAVDGTMLLFLVMAATSLNRFHQWSVAGNPVPTVT